jgi:4-hydroxybenzoate polyprenyltransferase
VSTRDRVGLLALPGALRPHQWTKNLLLFAGLVFGERTGDAGAWVAALVLFAAYCAASSAAYLVNDLADAKSDREHPTKHRRAVASGRLSPGLAAGAAAVLAALAFALAALAGAASVGLLGLFVALQLAYSLALKHVALLDVMAIGLLFVVRATAGAEGVDVELSPWLILCSGLLALFLALAKRRGELVQVGGASAPSRPVLDGYSLELVEQLLGIVAATTIGSYAIYTFTAADSDLMMATIPFVVFGIFRYLALVHRRDIGEEPERVLLTDRQILATVALWVAVAAAILVWD